MLALLALRCFSRFDVLLISHKFDLSRRAPPKHNVKEAAEKSAGRLRPSQRGHTGKCLFDLRARFAFGMYAAAGDGRFGEVETRRSAFLMKNEQPRLVFCFVFIIAHSSSSQKRPLSRPHCLNRSLVKENGPNEKKATRTALPLHSKPF